MTVTHALPAEQVNASGAFSAIRTELPERDQFEPRGFEFGQVDLVVVRRPRDRDINARAVVNRVGVLLAERPHARVDEPPHVELDRLHRPCWVLRGHYLGIAITATAYLHETTQGRA